MWLYLLVLLIVVVFIFIYRNRQFINFEIESKQYQIERYSPGRHESLNQLVQIRKRLDQLIQHLYREHPKDKYINRMKKRFEDTVLREANPKGDPSQTSYTINKGDTMVICLRTQDGRVVDFNTLMYVAIHELAHIYSSSYHHNTEFWKNMRFLIDQAAKIGIYRPVNYHQNPVRYCGIRIASNIPRTELPRQRGNQGQSGGGRNAQITFLLSRSCVI